MLAVLSLEWKESKCQLVVNAPKCFRVVNCDGESRPVLTIPLSFPEHLLRDCQRGGDFNDRASETLVSDGWCSKSNCSQFSTTVMRCVSIFPTLDNRGQNWSHWLGNTWWSLLMWENVCQRIRSCSAYFAMIDVYWEATFLFLGDILIIIRRPLALECLLTPR